VSGLAYEQDACLVMRETQASGSGAWADCEGFGGFARVSDDVTDRRLLLAEREALWAIWRR
jgi:hypothetical protein